MGKYLIGGFLWGTTRAQPSCCVLEGYSSIALTGVASDWWEGDRGQCTSFMVSDLVNVKFNCVVPAVKCQSPKCKNYRDAVCGLLGPR